MRPERRSATTLPQRRRPWRASSHADRPPPAGHPRISTPFGSGPGDPGGMYGHQNAGRLPAGLPAVHGARRGLPRLGRRRQRVRRPHVQLRPDHARPPPPGGRGGRRGAAPRGDCLQRPGRAVVELAELLVDVVAHADWAMFAKNGTDATTMCVTVARAADRQAKILVAEGAYHGAGAVVHAVARRRRCRRPRPPAALHVQRPRSRCDGRRGAPATTSRRSSCRRSSHDAGHDQELRRPGFARGLRARLRRAGAALILDDVRCRLPPRPRRQLGAAGRAPGPATGARRSPTATRSPPCRHRRLRERRRAHLRHRLVLVLGRGRWPPRWPRSTPCGDEDAIGHMERTGSACARARRAGRGARRRLNQTGPVQMPLMTFDDDAGLRAGGLSGPTSPPARRLPAPVAQLVPVRRPHRRRHRPRPRRHRRRLR